MKTAFPGITISFLLFLLIVATINPTSALSSVVINEIMYHPLSELDRDEYVEIYNTGNESVDLSGCALNGVAYKFPAGTVIDSGAYLVVAKDTNAFHTTYNKEALGPYDGVLKDGGEKLTLADAAGKAIDVVTYSDHAPWPTAADGLGASLECVNPNADNDHPRNWRASSGGKEWQYIEATAATSSTRLYIYLLGAGECLLDDVRIVATGGTDNLLLNGGFEEEGSWRAAGSHAASVRWNGDAHEGSYCMRLIASGAGSSYNDSLSQTVAGMAAGETYTISLWAKGVSGNADLLFRMSGNSHLTQTSLKGVQGTPGAINSAYAENIPPFATEVGHQPEEPASKDAVLVTARIDDADGIARAVLKYNVDNGSWREIALSDAGSDGDTTANDGVYSALIPPQPSQSAVRYKIDAEDGAGQISEFPLSGEPTPNYGYFVYDGEIASKVPLYWIFLENSDYQSLLSNPNDNNFRRGTFACRGKLYDNVGIRFRGQWARSWPKKSWKLRFNKDHYFDGRRTLNLNSCYHDRAYIREYLCYRFYREAGCAAGTAQFAHVRLNKDFYGLELDVEQVNEQFLEEWGFDPAGNLYKSKQNGDLRRLANVSAFNGPYEKKTNENGDWLDLKALADGLALTPTADMNAFLKANVDVERILQYWAATTILQNWDAIIKNHFLFHDAEGGGLWYMIPWDLDRTWGEYASWELGARINILAGMQRYPPGFGLPSDWWNRLIDAMLKQPDMLDDYYKAIRSQLDNLFTEERMNEWIDEQNELIKDLVPIDVGQWGTHGSWKYAQEIANCKTYVKERRAFLYNSLPAAVEEWNLY